MYDSPWLKQFSDDMVKKSRRSGCCRLADNGVRHFTNSKRVNYTSPDDMKGLKMRVHAEPRVPDAGDRARRQPVGHPVGGSCRPLFSKSVVDGQENGRDEHHRRQSVSVPEVHSSLDGHVWSIHGYTINEKFYQGPHARSSGRRWMRERRLPQTIHRKMTSDQDKNAKEILTKLGMEVTEPTPAALKQVP